ncbi:two-partner secretion domain-containing protein [Kamptonema formosum]|uniref:two-partner secretion domain-containing protein n=1 Tax=Kamptonema formosum TaxID=331992 RepID=UPI000376BDC8|nr:S-layer family protein [Oscillatoria sp. PCC 10802]
MSHISEMNFSLFPPFPVAGRGVRGGVRRRRAIGWKLGLCGCLLAAGNAVFFPTGTPAQTAPDATLPVNSAVTANGNTITITGGTVKGSNLFHSFEQFSLPTGRTAHFNNAPDIQNILTRVTGRSISHIDGTIQANGSANVFVLNPNGIIFGPNARLNIGGSFIASTAQGLNFADGSVFSAANPQNPPLLTVSVPVGLQFEANPGRILVRGGGRETTSGGGDTSGGLRAAPAQTLALVGSNVALEGGTLKTAGGRIEIGSVAGAGTVSLTPAEKGFSLGYEGVPAFGDIQLSGEASADASGAGGGDVQVTGRRVTLTGGSAIEANTWGSQAGGTLKVQASELVELAGTSSDGSIPSALSAEVRPAATGRGGNLTVVTGRLIVRGGALVSAATRGEGAAGSLTVRASESVELAGESAVGGRISGLSAQVAPGATGAGGNLTVETGRLIIRDGAAVSSATFGAGKGGNLTARASESVEVTGATASSRFASALSAQVETGATGAGGNVTVETGRLIVRDGAQVSSGSLGLGQGGSLAVRATHSVELSGTSANGISSGLVAEAQGDAGAGDLTVETGRLTVRNGAAAVTSSLGAGKSGNLTVRASESVELSGVAGERPSGLLTRSFGTGDAGDLTIETQRLAVRGGARVSASTFQGKGGTVTVRAKESVELSGSATAPDGEINSGLFAQTVGPGDAGNLSVETGRLSVSSGAEVRVNATDIMGSGMSGAAGNLEIQAGSIRLDSGELAARTISGKGGNIRLLAREVLLLRHNSSISTEAGSEGSPGTGGSIAIQTGALAALENSDIDANAFQGRGGEVRVDARSIFGAQARAQQDDRTSDITASSTGGPQLSGTVEINTPDAHPTQGLVELPENPVDAAGLIDRNPCALGKGSSFAVTGSGGLPPSPSDALSSNSVWEDWGTAVAGEVGGRGAAGGAVLPVRQEIVEAQEWEIGAGGEVILTGSIPVLHSRVPGSCPLR